MTRLNQEGTYRGKILDHGVSETTNGYPQFTPQILALERWEEDTEEWVDFSEYDASLTGYFTLVDSKGKTTLNMDQVMKSTGWNGQSFADLAAMDLSKTIIQFRAEEDEYDGVTRLKMSWIDHKDATPGVKVKKLDIKELKNLDSKYSSILKAGKSTPAASKRSTETKKSGRPPKKKETVKESTIEETWEVFNKYAEKEKWDGDKINKVWLQTIEAIVGDKDEDDITPEEWGKIQTRLTDGIPF